MKTITPSLITLTLFCGLATAGAVELEGTVLSATKENAKIEIKGELMPAIGDAVKIYFKLPGVEQEISVASAKVTGVSSDAVTAKIEKATGAVANNQLARITSEKPQKRSAVAATPAGGSVASSPKPTGTQSTTSTKEGSPNGRDPSFAFVDMNKVFKSFSKTKEADKKIDDAKAQAKQEYDARAANYKKLLDEIKALKDNQSSPRESKIAEIKQMETEINDFKTRRENELQRDALKLRKGLVEEITRHLKTLTSGANLVFDGSGNSLNGCPVVLVAPSTSETSGRLSSDLEGKSSNAISGTRDLKIATVDMNRIFRSYNKTKDAEKKIVNAKEQAKKEYDERADAYKKALDELYKLDPEAEGHDEKVAKIKTMEREVNEFRQKREKELGDEGTRLRAGIVAEMTKAIQTKTSSESAALVFDQSGQTPNDAPVLLWSAGLPDLSQQIIDVLNGSTTRASSADVQLTSSSQLRFGLCDLNRAFKELPESKEADGEIRAEKDKAKSEPSGAEDSVRKAREKEIKASGLKKREAILQKLKDAVARLGEQGHYNLIFDSSGMSLNGVPILVEAHDMPDLTDDVIAQASK